MWEEPELRNNLALKACSCLCNSNSNSNSDDKEKRTKNKEGKSNKLVVKSCLTKMRQRRSEPKEQNHRQPVAFLKTIRKTAGWQYFLYQRNHKFDQFSINCVEVNNFLLNKSIPSFLIRGMKTNPLSIPSMFLFLKSEYRCITVIHHMTKTESTKYRS